MEQLNKKLLRACENGNVKKVKKYLDLGADANCKDILENTALYVALSHSDVNPKIITSLLENGVNPDEKDKKGRTALHVAVDIVNVNPSIISSLLENGFKPDEKDEQGRTALHVVIGKSKVNPDIVTTLLEHGVKPDEKDKEGRTVLHIAVGRSPEDENVIRTLLESGCGPNEKNKEGRTVLHLAAGKPYANPNTIEMLIKNGCKPNEKDEKGSTALHIAACQQVGDQSIIQTLITNGCHVDAKDGEGRTALHIAACQPYVYPSIITTLLENGCTIDEKDVAGRTALHEIVGRVDVEPVFIEYLFQQGCNPAEQDNKGDTALHKAAFHANAQKIHILLERGCKSNQKNYKGKTALHVAAENPYVDPVIIAILLENGCKPDEQDNEGNIPRYLLEKNRDKEELFDRQDKNASIKLLKEYEKCSQLGLPIEVKELDKKSANVFSSLLVDEGYHHYEARVMLAGEQGTGKSTIARYLVGKGPTKIRISTDGIDLYNGLSFIDRDTEEWMHGKQEFTLSEVATSRSLRQSERPSTKLKKKKKKGKTADQDTSIPERIACPEFKTENTSLLTSELTHQSSSSRYMTTEEQLTLKDSVSDEKDAPQMNLMQSNEEHFGDDFFITSTDKDQLPDKSKKLQLKHIKFQHDHDDTIIKSGEISFTKVVKNPGIIGKLKKLFGVHRDVEELKVSMTKDKFWEESLRVGKKKLHQKKMAPVIIWDFGGQDVFYSTHQTFLTYRAIYLVVLDGSRYLDDPCPFEQYLPGKSGPKTARDYLKFWINTIVTYCKGSGPGFPKIMIVLTHKDKVKDEEVEPRRHQLFHDIEMMFSGSPLLIHLVIRDRIFVNARNKRDPEMTNITKNIIEQAMDQPTWGQKLPKCFIPLELEFDSLLSRNVPLITMHHMKIINCEQPVRPLTEEELQIFLKFQHSIGRILYFEEANLNQHIILAPTHLIDAFKSIVTDRRFCKGDRLRQESWDLMSQKGVISKKSIEDIWKKKKYKKFNEHKEYLLGVMTHLDILVEPKRYDKSQKRIPAEFYYIASMVRTKDTTGYLGSPTFGQRNIAIAFSPSSSMIPPALSFRFVSYCLSIWAVKTYGQNNDEMLFHMSAVFTIDPSLDMLVNCDDEMIVVRLVHSRNRTLIMRDLTSSIRECLAVALEKISQLYVKTSSTGPIADKSSFNLSLCCSSPVDPCLLSMFKLEEQDSLWICPKHGIEHSKDVLSSWTAQKENIHCGVACPVTDDEFLKQFPTDIHLRRLSMQFSVNETKELAIHLGMEYKIWERLSDTISEEPERLNFETLRRCLDRSYKTFNDIRKAVESGNIQNPHILCKVVRGTAIDFDHEPEKWDLVLREEHFDRIAPLVGNSSLAFLVELGMDFETWEQIRYKQKPRDLVKLNRHILQEWKSRLNIRPSLRHIGQAFNNIGKNIKIIENVLADFF